MHKKDSPVDYSVDSLSISHSNARLHRGLSLFFSAYLPSPPHRTKAVIDVYRPRIHLAEIWNLKHGTASSVPLRRMIVRQITFNWLLGSSCLLLSYHKACDATRHSTLCLNQPVVKQLKAFPLDAISWRMALLSISLHFMRFNKRASSTWSLNHEVTSTDILQSYRGSCTVSKTEISRSFKRCSLYLSSTNNS